ncbi:MAG: hypothetical protein Q4G51_03005 [Dermatophilus congolensis]|nr:hypothetical protein [Dermatophilus congolensis]
MDPFESARRQGYADLPVTESAWIFCASRLVGQDPTFVPTHQHLLDTHKLATSKSFPNGPLAFMGKARDDIFRDNYLGRELRFERDGRLMATAFIGIGHAGFAAIAASRHEHVDSTVHDVPLPAHVLQSDVEGYLIDMLLWSWSFATTIGFEGEIEVEVSISDEVPGHPLTLCRVDPDTGAVDLANAYQSPFTPHRFSLWTHEDPPTVHERLAHAAQSIGQQFGGYDLQYIIAPDPERPTDFYPTT